MSTMGTMGIQNTQQGGMKIIVKNDQDEDISIHEIRDMQEFINIFSNTSKIDILSVNSLTGFILRITLPDNTSPFRSDVFNEQGELLTAEEYDLPNTGRVVTQHVLKCCIVQPTKKPIITMVNNLDKSTCTSEELKQEYKTQSDIYRGTMAYGGMPVCPDVYAVMEFNLKQFTEIFFSDNSIPDVTDVTSLPSISTNVSAGLSSCQIFHCSSTSSFASIIFFYVTL